MAAAAAVAGLVIGVAGGFAGAKSERTAGKAAKRQGQLQAATEIENAVVAQAVAERDAELRRLQGQKLVGAQRAAIGASGATALGSFQDIVAESARITEFEARDIEFAGAQRRQDFTNRATQFLQFGRVSEGQARRRSIGTLLQSGAQGALGTAKLISSTAPISAPPTANK